MNPRYSLRAIDIYIAPKLYKAMRWIVELYSDFESEFAKLDEAVQDELLAMAGLLEIYGPRLGRPHADTLSIVQPHVWKFC